MEQKFSKVAEVRTVFKTPFTERLQINYLDSFPVVTDGESGITTANQNGNGSSKALMDPWGNPFLVILDHDLDGDVEAQTLGCG